MRATVASESLPLLVVCAKAAGHDRPDLAASAGSERQLKGTFAETSGFVM